MIENNLIVKRAARLICTTPEFDDLAKEIFGKRGTGECGTGVPPVIHGRDGHATRGEHGQDARATIGATEPVERGKLRVELDGQIAHLYGLTEDGWDSVERSR